MALSKSSAHPSCCSTSRRNVNTVALRNRQQEGRNPTLVTLVEASLHDISISSTVENCFVNADRTYAVYCTSGRMCQCTGNLFSDLVNTRGYQIEAKLFLRLAVQVLSWTMLSHHKIPVEYDKKEAYARGSYNMISYACICAAGAGSAAAVTESKTTRMGWCRSGTGTAAGPWRRRSLPGHVFRLGSRSC
eukprot:IDg2882t1